MAKSDRMTLLIQVAGQVGSGKTTVARLIEEALRDHGFEVKLEDSPEGSKNLSLEIIEKRKAALVRYPVQIQIQTKQLAKTMR